MKNNQWKIKYNRYVNSYVKGEIVQMHDYIVITVDTKLQAEIIHISGKSLTNAEICKLIGDGCNRAGILRGKGIYKELELNNGQKMDRKKGTGIVFDYSDASCKKEGNFLGSIIYSKVNNTSCGEGYSYIQGTIIFVGIERSVTDNEIHLVGLESTNDTLNLYKMIKEKCAYYNRKR